MFLFGMALLSTLSLSDNMKSIEINRALTFCSVLQHFLAGLSINVLTTCDGGTQTGGVS